MELKEAYIRLTPHLPYGSESIPGFYLYGPPFGSRKLVFQQLKEEHEPKTLFEQEGQISLEQLTDKLLIEGAVFIGRAVEKMKTYRDVIGAITDIDNFRGIMRVLHNDADNEGIIDRVGQELIFSEIPLNDLLYDYFISEKNSIMAGILMVDAINYYFDLENPNSERHIQIPFQDLVSFDLLPQDVRAGRIELGAYLAQKLDRCKDIKEPNALAPDKTPHPESLKAKLDNTEKLKADLEDAVEREDYERAAELRDAIKTTDTERSYERIHQILVDLSAGKPSTTLTPNEFIRYVGYRLLTEIFPEDVIYYVGPSLIKIRRRTSPTKTEPLLEVRGDEEYEPKTFIVHDKSYLPRLLWFIHNGTYPMIYGRFPEIKIINRTA